MSTIDLNNTTGKGKLEWTSGETEAEEATRLRQEEARSKHELRVQWWTFLAYLAALFTVGIAGLLLTFNGGTPERERVGIVFLTAIVSGSIGYLSGKGRK